MQDDLDAVRQRIVDRAAEKKTTLAELSKAIGKNHAYMQQFVKRGIPRELPERVRRALAEQLEIPEGDLRAETDEPSSVRRVALPAPARGSMQNDVPVKGNAAGGSGADFYMNGETIDYVRRPPGVARQAGIFALYVVGTSMYPKYEDGNLIYASSSRSPSIGDFVVVELHPSEDGGDTPGFIKRLIKRTASKIICEQFNPPKTVEFELRRVKALHRVVPLEELLGV